MRVVVDANVYVSAILFPESLPATLLRQVLDRHETLSSVAHAQEVGKVIARSKFERYLPLGDRLGAARILLHRAILVQVSLELHLCRDPKDDYLVNLALDGRADLLISGDGDLLTLEMIGPTRVVSPSEAIQVLQTGAR